MRKSILGSALLCATLFLVAQSPSIHVRAEAAATGQGSSTRAQSPAPPATNSSHRVEPEKETDIRHLMEITGAASVGQQLTKAGLDQLRASVMEAHPDDPRSKQFMDAFTAQFQKHFDSKSLADNVLPIYDKYLSSEDVKALIEYYKTPFGQRMLKVLPDLARDSQNTSFALVQKAAQKTMEDLYSQYPEFISDPTEEPKPPLAPPKDN
ncbi:MAG TPA: DUF2059 domain-containing protein [Candidatus Acidoferrum sp.]|jgi:hypothetical protein